MGESVTAMVGASAVRVPKAGEMVAAQLRRQIVLGELKEGDVLPSEAVLMEQFGVSRPTLREAYRILEAESIITVRRGSRGGARVLVPNRKVAAHHSGLLLQHRGTLLADVYDGRAIVEASAVGELARVRTAKDLLELETAIEEAHEVIGDALAFAERDADFHRLVVRLAGNSTIELLVGMLYHIIESHNRSYLATHDHAAERPAAAAAERAHKKLVGLIRDKNVDGAAAFWRKHLADVRAHMIDDPSTTVVEILS